MHKTDGVRDPATAFPLPVLVDDAGERRLANRAIAVGAAGLAANVPGVRHAHARARWTGRTLRLEVDGWIAAETTVADADAVGRAVAHTIARELPDVRRFTWTARAV